MKFTAVVFHLIACANVSLAFSPLLVQRSSTLATTYKRAPTHIFSTQWDEDDEDDVASEVVATEADTRRSFSDAGAALVEEDDKKKMDDMGDYDSNPAYNSADIDRVREAIRQRTEMLGIEKSKVSQEMIQQAQEQAKAQIANGKGGQMLDLSQISNTAPRGEDDETPAMLYDPAAEMSDEEMIEADPDGQLSIPEQIKLEMREATWPTPVAAVKEVGLLVVIVLITAGLIIYWDDFLRNFYTNLGFIPKPEDILSGGENMVLPDGWTSNMSEDDFMNFQDEIGSSAKKAVDSGFPDL